MVSQVFTLPQPSFTLPKASPRPTSPQFGGLKGGVRSDTYQATKTKAAKFGDGDKNGLLGGVGNFVKKATAITVGALSVGGLAIGVPLGLMQMAVGIFFHPLLITGALTMALPLAGLLGSIWLGTKK